MHEFEVDETGLVTYAAAKEPFFDGLGTSQLTLVGYSIGIDATALTSGSFSIGGVDVFPTTALHTLIMLPGIKSLSSAEATFDFEVEEDGLLEYEVSLDAILSGRGTNTLTVTPAVAP